MDATREEWRPIVGFEGLYEVSSRGRVRSLDHSCHGADGVVKRWRGRTMKLGLSTNGYLRLNLTKRGGQKSYKVHQLVIQAFCGPKPFVSACVRHLNDNRTDNRIENLAWGTVAENNRDMLRNGTNYNASKTHCRRGHEFTPDNTIPNGAGRRSCRTCRHARDARRRKRLLLQRNQGS